MLRARHKDTESQKRKHAADQPRPALGRRPWFALLRRARSLRRFALAIRRESVARSRRFVTVASQDGGWAATDVLLAESCKDRRRGVLTSVPRVLLQTCCVHSVGVAQSLRVVGIDRHGTVQEQQILDPRRLLRIPGVVWVLELPIDDPHPEIGERLDIYARRCERQADYLRNTDR